MSSNAQGKPQRILLRPFHRANSDRVLESTKDAPVKVYLNMPEQLQISNYSFIQDDKGNRRATRYYHGCTTIFLDEQLKAEKANQEPRRILQLKDTIFIKNGIIEVVDQEPFRSLFKFLSTHNDNVSNPNRVPPPNGEDYTAFEVLDYQKAANSELSEIELRDAAFSVLNKVRLGTGATRKFNEGELAKLKSIFGITDESDEESYMALYKIASGNPKEFVARVDQINFMIIADFEAAKLSKALTYEDGKYYINDELVYTASEKNIAKQDAEFIDFLSKPTGGHVYTQLRTQTETNILQAK